MAESSDSGTQDEPIMYSQKSYPVNSLDNASWDVNSEIQNQGYFDFSSKHRLKHSFDLPPGRGHLMNGLKNQIPDTIQSSCDKSYHKVDSISVPIFNNDSAHSLINSTSESLDQETSRNLSRGRNRRKPKHSLSKTELYEENVDDNFSNNTKPSYEMGDQGQSSLSDENDSNFHIRRSMQRIRPEYVQVPADPSYIKPEFAQSFPDSSSKSRVYDQVPQQSNFTEPTCEQVPPDASSLLGNEIEAESQKNQFECKECHITLSDFDLYTDHLMSHHTSHENSGINSQNMGIYNEDMLNSIAEMIKARTGGNEVNQGQSDSCSMSGVSEGGLEIDLSPNLEDRQMGEGMKTEVNTEEGMEIKNFEGKVKGKRGRKKKTEQSSPDTNSIKCPVCSKGFKTRNNLKTHLCKFHSEKTDVLRSFFAFGEKLREKSVCNLCGKCFISKTALQRHVESRHPGETIAKFSECPEEFKNNKLLFDHVSKHHENGSIHNHKPDTSEELSHVIGTKEILDKNENHQTSLKANVLNQAATNRNLLLCDEATLVQEIQKAIADPRTRNTHQNHEIDANHSSNVSSEQEEMELVGTEPQTSHYFQREIDLPTEESEKTKDIYCSVCLLFFESVEKLMLHYVTSSECLNSKECPVCGKVINSSLKEHLKSHSDDRPYQCEICKASFKRNHQMKLHKQTVHSDLRLYHCELCEKSFKRRDKLTCHYRTHSDEHPFMCTECGSVFKWKHHLKRHRDNVHADKASQIKARRFPCSVCGNCFKWRHHLKRHLRNVHRLFDGLWDGEDTKMSLDSENSLAVPKSSLPVVGSEELSKVDGNS